MNNYNDPHQQYMMQQQQQYGQFDQQSQQGMHPNMQMPHNPQRMPMEHQRSNFPQPIQRIPSQGTFQVNAGQPSQFQPSASNTSHQYMVRPPQQQMPNVMMRSSGQGQAQNAPMQPRMVGPPPPGMQQPRMMHQNYANSPQYQSGAPNAMMSSSMQGPQIDTRYIISQMPSDIRNRFETETDSSRKNQIFQMFARQFQRQPTQQVPQQPQQYNQFEQPNQMSQSQIPQQQNVPGMHPTMQTMGMSQPRMTIDQQRMAAIDQQRMAAMDQQRMTMDQQRMTMDQQHKMQNVSTHGNYQMNPGQAPPPQPSHFQPTSSGPPPQQYLIRNSSQQPPSQQMQNVMKHSPMPQPSIGSIQQSSSIPNSITLQQQTQQRTNDPPSTGNVQQPCSMYSNYTSSPQTSQPPNTQNSQSAAPTPRPAPVDTNNPEYKELLTELKSYRKDAKTLLERARVDGYDALERSLVRVMDIMEGKKDVDIKKLGELLSNLKNGIRQHNPVRALHDFVGRINTVPQNLDEPILPECWDRLEQYRIQVPAHVLKHLEKVKEQEQHHRKRRLSEETPEEAEDGQARFEVPCVHQKSTRLTLPKAITDELLSYSFTIDPDSLPISEHVIYAQILVDFKPKEVDKFKYFVPPLKLSIPVVKYPHMPIQLVPIHENSCSPLQIRIMDALKKNITDSTMHSITELISLWQKIVIQNVIPASDVETRRLISVT